MQQTFVGFCAAAMVVVVAAVFVGEAGAASTYRPCNESGSFFFLSPVLVGMTSVVINNPFPALAAQGVHITSAVSGSLDLAVYLVASPDHYFEVDFDEMGSGNVRWNITVSASTISSGACSLTSGQSLMLSSMAAAAGLVGAASSRSAAAGMGTASAVAGAALGLSLFGPLASAQSLCPNSFVNVTYLIPPGVNNITINGQTTCFVPYQNDTATGLCTICNSQQLVEYDGAQLPYFCVPDIYECCPHEFCVSYTFFGYNSTRCCPVESQINSTACCPYGQVYQKQNGTCTGVEERHSSTYRELQNMERNEEPVVNFAHFNPQKAAEAYSTTLQKASEWRKLLESGTAKHPVGGTHKEPTARY